MAKSAGFLKKLKKLGDLIGKGASWINTNVVKPLRPVIDTGLDMLGVGTIAKPAMNLASNWLDNTFGSTPNKQIQTGINVGADLLLDTQRAPSQRKYGNLW